MSLTPYYSDESVTLYHSDALAALAERPAAAAVPLLAYALTVGVRGAWRKWWGS